MTAFAAALRAIGRAVPGWLPRGTAVGNRLLKPIYRLVDGRPAEAVETWRGVRMNLDPLECIGGNLFFSPHLYDRRERAWIDAHLPADGVFVDIGANIGAYTLWALSRLDAKGRIVAIEADPGNYQALAANIALNSRAGRIDAVNIGVSDQNGELPFYHNPGDNAGGHSFVAHPGHEPAGAIPVRPLSDVLGDLGIDRIDLMKIDIEGYERVVLRRFFADCAAGPDRRPRHIMIEVDEGPMAGNAEVRADLLGLLANAGYVAVAGDGNMLFERKA